MSRENTPSAGKPRLVALDQSDSGLGDICRLLQGVIEVVPLKDWERVKQTIKADANVVAVLVDHATGPGEVGGVALLEQVRTIRPTVRRVLISYPGDLGGLLDGLHSGVIERVVYKPFDRRELVSSFVTALSQPARSA